MAILSRSQDQWTAPSPRLFFRRPFVIRTRLQRIALIGDNGSGKTSVLKMLRGDLQPASGTSHIPGYISVADAYQHPLWTTGMLRSHLRGSLKPHHLLLWDEPVNYIDIHSREQIENVILRDTPTMLFTEHDRTFVETIATQVIVMPKM
jgi:ATPase subunit of ABC transporter with duplicated ATPase domains